MLRSPEPGAEPGLPQLSGKFPLHGGKSLAANPGGESLKGAASLRHVFEEDLDLIRPRGSSKTGLKTKAAANLLIGER